MDNIKKRKLVLSRETVMPLQYDLLSGVHGGKGKPHGDSSQNALSRAAESAQASGVVSAAGSGLISVSVAETLGTCIAVSGATSAIVSAGGGSLDHVSEKHSKPCWLAGSIVSASVHFTRKW